MSSEPAPPSSGAVFVAFEGGDGVGKSTQARLLAEALQARGREVLLTRQPGGTSLGERLRELVLHGGDLAARAEALLFAADKAQHVAHTIRPALARGVDVVTDRYVASSVAYQGVGRDLGPAEIARLLDWAVEGLAPSLTVVLDVPVDVARRRRRAAADRVESEDDGFHERVRRAFLGLAAADPAHYLLVDASSAPDLLAREVLDTLGERGLLRGPSLTELLP